MKSWIVVARWKGEVHTFPFTDAGARAVAHVWGRVRHLEDTSCRLDDGQTVLGTKMPGEAYTGGPPFLSVCQDCGKEVWMMEPNGLFCVGCQLLDLRWPWGGRGPMRLAPAWPTRHPFLEVLLPTPLLGVGVHEAGPVTPSRLQLCARCGGVLKDLRIRGVDIPLDAPGPLGVSGGGPYPVGSFIERGAGWQAMSLRADHATCEEPPND